MNTNEQDTALTPARYEGIKKADFVKFDHVLNTLEDLCVSQQVWEFRFIAQEVFLQCYGAKNFAPLTIDEQIFTVKPDEPLAQPNLVLRRSYDEYLEDVENYLQFDPDFIPMKKTQYQRWVKSRVEDHENVLKSIRDRRYADYIEELDFLNQPKGKFLENFLAMESEKRHSILKNATTRYILLAMVSFEEGFQATNRAFRRLYTEGDDLHTFQGVFGANAIEKLALRALIGHTIIDDNGLITESYPCDRGKCRDFAMWRVVCPYCDSSEFLCSRDRDVLFQAALAPDLRFNKTCTHWVTDYRECQIHPLYKVNAPRSSEALVENQANNF